VAYLSQSIMADDQYLRLRVASCAAQEGVTDAGINPDEWTLEWKRVWSAGTGWALKWEEAQSGGVVDPGAQPDVITDDMIKDQVNLLKPFKHVEDNKSTESPQAAASREFVLMHTEPLNGLINAVRGKLEENFPDLPWDILFPSPTPVDTA
jgi:hypothetical protein